MKYQENQHFSHHHVLNSLTLLHQDDDEIICDACEQDITEPSFHGCMKCKYFLHDKCLNTPRSLEHPSHPSHPLTLHPTSTYFSRAYSCDACGSNGKGFTLCCAYCGFDIHLECANLPASVLTNKHPHQLKLIFDSPYANANTVIKCDICLGNMNPRHWAYYCVGCDFGSHLDCVKGKPRPRKEKAKKAEAEKRAGSSRQQQGQGQGHFTPSADDINAINKAEEAMAAAHIRAMIAAQGQQAALDLI